MFFETKDGCQYPVSQIVRIFPPLKETVDVELSSGLTVKVFPQRITELMRRPMTTFSAQPETYIVQVGEESGKIWKTAVIGWGVALDGATYPITADGTNDGLDDCLYVLTPDGMVTQRECGTQTFESWLEEQKIELKAA